MPVTLLGFPWDTSSSYARGPALAPSIIRSVLSSDASSSYSLDGVDFRDVISGYDFTDLPQNAEACRAEISKRIAALAPAQQKPLSLGGDHSVTYPILRALKEAHGPLNILHIDAHPDLYEEFEGDRFSHACPFARAIEDGCVNNLVQVGIRSASPAQREFGEKHSVTMLGSEQADAVPYEKLVTPLYISIDLDGLDPAFAPGVSHPEPSGLSTREVLAMLAKLPVAPIGADIVEYNPERDLNLMTAHVAARLIKELSVLMAR